jgi:hypothetical protein
MPFFAPVVVQIRELCVARILAEGRRAGLLRKTAFLSHFYIKTIILPRQARDKHRENSKKEDAVFSHRRCAVAAGALGVCGVEGEAGDSGAREVISAAVVLARGGTGGGEADGSAGAGPVVVVVRNLDTVEAISGLQPDGDRSPRRRGVSVDVLVLDLDAAVAEERDLERRGLADAVCAGVPSFAVVGLR